MYQNGLSVLWVRTSTHFERPACHAVRGKDMPLLLPQASGLNVDPTSDPLHGSNDVLTPQCNASCLRTRLPSVSKPSIKMQTHPPFKLLQIHHSLILYDSYDHIRSVYICVLALPSNVLMHLMSSVSCIHLYACRSA